MTGETKRNFPPSGDEELDHRFEKGAQERAGWEILVGKPIMDAIYNAARRFENKSLDAGETPISREDAEVMIHGQIAALLNNIEKSKEK